jgi:hypothetical protein
LKEAAEYCGFFVFSLNAFDGWAGSPEVFDPNIGEHAFLSDMYMADTSIADT